MSLSPQFLFVLNLAGCVALLLWGSYTVRGAVEKAYAARLGALLSATTGSRLGSLAWGLVSALAMQSTTAAIILTTSFLRTGLVTLPVAIVVIIGADIGSALAVRILFLDLSFLGPLLLFAGICTHRVARTWRKKQLGVICIGLGLMLLSIQLIRQLIDPLSTAMESSQVLQLIQSSPWLGLVLGAFLTWLAHSSVAMILTVASMAAAGILQLEFAIAMLVGSNIGSGLIPLTLVSRADTDSYSAVVANLLMRTALGLVAMFGMPLYLPQIGLLGTGAGIQIVNLHVFFNLLLAVVFVPLNQWSASLSRQLLSSGPVDLLQSDPHQPGSSLDPDLVRKPDRAIACARREAFRLADNTEALFGSALQMFEADDRLVIDRFIERDREINMRNKAIQKYLADTRNQLHASQEVDSELENQLDDILQFSSAMENIGDVVSYSLARLAVKKLDRGVEFSSPGFEELSVLHAEVASLVRMEVTRFAGGGRENPKSRNKLINQISSLAQDTIASHRLRLSRRKSSSIGTSSIHQDAVRDLLQVVSFLSSLEAR